MSISDLKQRIQSMKQKTLEVGWFADARYDDDTAVAQVAEWNEYGTVTAPARPFIRPCMEQNKGRWSKDMASAIKAVVDGHTTPQGALDAVGDAVHADLQQTISKVSSPPLAPSTIKARDRKGRSHQPLNDTGLMIASVRWRVK